MRATLGSSPYVNFNPRSRVGSDSKFAQNTIIVGLNRFVESEDFQCLCQSANLGSSE